MSKTLIQKLQEGWPIITAVIATAFAAGIVYNQIREMQKTVEQRDVSFGAAVVEIRKDVKDVRESIALIQTHLAEDRTMLKMILRDNQRTTYYLPDAP